nr:helix-turn-helix transcriptional regulator [Holzapfeliella floricola]
MKLSQKLEKKRKQLQLTQDQVSREIHVSRQTISNWETGKTLPDIESLIALSDTYNISLDELIKGDKQIINKLKTNTKREDNIFGFSGMIYAVLNVWLGYYLLNPDLKIGINLIVLQSIAITVYAMYGWNFIKKEQLKLQSENAYRGSRLIINHNIILYGAVFFGGYFTALFRIWQLF